MWQCTLVQRHNRRETFVSTFRWRTNQRSNNTNEYTVLILRTLKFAWIFVPLFMLSCGSDKDPPSHGFENTQCMLFTTSVWIRETFSIGGADGGLLSELDHVLLGTDHSGVTDAMCVYQMTLDSNTPFPCFSFTRLQYLPLLKSGLLVVFFFFWCDIPFYSVNSQSWLLRTILMMYQRKLRGLVLVWTQNKGLWCSKSRSILLVFLLVPLTQPLMWHFQGSSFDLASDLFATDAQLLLCPGQRRQKLVLEDGSIMRTKESVLSAKIVTREIEAHCHRRRPSLNIPNLSFLSEFSTGVNAFPGSFLPISISWKV